MYTIPVWHLSKCFLNDTPLSLLITRVITRNYAWFSLFPWNTAPFNSQRMHKHDRVAFLLSTALPLYISIPHHLHHNPLPCNTHTHTHTESEIKSETWSGTVQLPLSMDTMSQNRIYEKNTRETLTRYFDGWKWSTETYYWRTEAWKSPMRGFLLSFASVVE